VITVPHSLVYIYRIVRHTEKRRGAIIMERVTDWKEFVFSALTPSQRIELAMDLWDSIPVELHSALLSTDQVTELRRRITETDAGRMQSHSWNDVKHGLLHQSS
jgi:putative addiction module component (TIGR02574 family)